MQREIELQSEWLALVVVRSPDAQPVVLSRDWVSSAFHSWLNCRPAEADHSIGPPF